MAYNKVYPKYDDEILPFDKGQEDRVEDAIDGVFSNVFHKVIKVTEDKGNVTIDLPFNIAGTHQQQNESVFIGSSVSQEYDEQASMPNTFLGASVNVSVRYGNRLSVHWNLGRSVGSGRYAFIYIYLMKFD